MNTILNNENKGRIKVNNSEIILNAFNKPKLKLINLGNKTKGPSIIIVPLLAAKEKGYKRVSYNISNKPVNHNQPMNTILNYLGFNQRKEWAPRTMSNLTKLRVNLSNYKRYMNEHKHKNINNRIKKFNNSFQKRSNVKYERTGKNKRVIKTLNGKSELHLRFLNNGVLKYNYGITNKNTRGQGHGKFLRRIPINIARNAGFKKIVQRSIWENKTQYGVKNNNNTPPSRRILEKLGFGISNQRGHGKIKEVNSVLLL